jgi:hypothetical protein
MAFFESAVSALETVIVALGAGIKAMGEMNENGKLCRGQHKCHAIFLSSDLGMKVLIPRTMKPPPR